MLRVIFVASVLLVCHHASAKNIVEEIKSRPDLSDFSNAIQSSSDLLKLLLVERSYTVFAPTNEAMKIYRKTHDKEPDESFVRYHLYNQPQQIQDLPSDFGSDLEGNPSLYITKMPSNRPSITGWEDVDYYVNNAKVIQANIVTKGGYNKKQYLHTIDRALTPTIPSSYDDSLAFTNPDALMLLLNPSLYGLKDELAVRNLAKRVQDLKANDSFALEGKNTFFLPVDEAFKQFMRNDKDGYTKQMVNGHVIPGKVLFSRTIRNSNLQYETLPSPKGPPVYLSMQNVTDSDQNTVEYYVCSSILKNSAPHVKGSAIARIVKGNIPVKNGVVHLIDRPLMMVATNIMSYVQAQDGQMSKFYNLIAEHFPDLVNLLVSAEKLTLFAPSNTAFDSVDKQRLDKVIANREKLSKMLKLHVVNRRLMTDEIVERSLGGEPVQEPTMSEKRNLFFAVNNMDSVVPVVSLEGAGVNATITTPNIVAKNGMIHIIDHILGIPSQTIYEKLASDPMLSQTYKISDQRSWNKKLNDKKKKYTLFVPSNKAWEQIKRDMPSSYQKLFMGSYPVHGINILERHMILNEDLSLEELAALTKNSSEAVLEDIKRTRLTMTRGKVYFQAKVIQNFREYFVEWHSVTARVIRPDVECTNGVVHVIDKVLMSRNDVTVNGSDRKTSALSVLMAMLSAVAAWGLI